jgi:AcrR family transcriptional regulator
MKNKTTPSANRGRPRTFDTDQALDRAIPVFWAKGYEGTVVDDLTEVMGINPSSFYAAFGNKGNAYLKTLDRYSHNSGGFIKIAMEQPSALAFAKKLLSCAVDSYTDPAHPCGCLFMNAGLGLTRENKAVRQSLLQRRSEMEKVFAQRFERAIANGELPKKPNPHDLARYLIVTLQGLATQAAAGTTRAELQKVVDLALTAFHGLSCTTD